MKFRIHSTTLKAFLACLLLALAYIYGLQPALHTVHETNFLNDGEPIDGTILWQGLRSHPHFSDVLKCFYGTWIAGEVRLFYRPLTSLVWWLQYKAWGDQGLQAFLIVHFVWHALVCLTAVCLFRRIVGARLAVLTVSLWASGLLALLTLPVPQEAMYAWKDDPDMAVSICIMLCLWALLSYWRTGQKKYFVGAVAAQIVGIGFKEMAYVSPLLAAWLLWYESKGEPSIVRRYAPSVMALLSVVIVAYTFRTWILGGKGFFIGSNGSWLYRWLGYCVGGRFTLLLALGETAPLALALLPFTVVAFFKKRPQWGLGLGLSSIALVLYADYKTQSWGETFNRIITPFPLWAQTIYSDALLSLSLILLWAMFLRSRDKTQWFGYGWQILAYAPLLLSPISAHALYLPSLGWSLWLACMINTWIEAARDHWPLFMPQKATLEGA